MPLHAVHDTPRARGRTPAVLAALLVAMAGPLRAQGTPAADQPLDEAAVEQKPLVLPNTCQPPTYPMQMRVARIEGRVTLQFVVDTLGHVEPRTIEVVQSSHSLFSTAARRVVTTCRYHPARAGNRPVRVRVQMPYDFRINGG
jgi:periplasmic protein TonB